MNAVMKDKVSSIHSAVNPCSENSSCKLCFNNIVDDRGFVLMLTPKVCTQSIVHAYNASLNDLNIKFRSKASVERVMFDSLVIGFVRNPFDRFASCWQHFNNNGGYRTWSLYGIENNCSFEEFVNAITRVPYEIADKHWRPMSYDLITEEGILIPHHIVRFESIDQDYEYIRRAISSEVGVKLGNLTHRNSSGKKPYKEYYTDELVDKVAEYYSDDLMNFNYRF